MVALIQSLEAAVKLAAFPAGLMLLASVIMFRVTVRRWRCASRGGRTGYQHQMGRTVATQVPVSAFQRPSTTLALP